MNKVTTTTIEMKIDYIYLGYDEYFYITGEHDSPIDPYPMIGVSLNNHKSFTDWKRFASIEDCTEIGHKDDYPEMFI